MIEKFNSGKIIGLSLGGLLGLCLAIFGFWKTILIVFLIVIGFFLGRYFEEERRIRK
ncbi:MAG: DUF2273 domain-containing protein [Candidatus Edwardsbacteria bacterium]